MEVSKCFSTLVQINNFICIFSRPESSPGCSDEDVESTAETGTYKDDWGSVWQLLWHLTEEDNDVSYFNKNCEESGQFIY